MAKIKRSILFLLKDIISGVIFVLWIIKVITIVVSLILLYFVPIAYISRYDFSTIIKVVLVVGWVIIATSIVRTIIEFMDKIHENKSKNNH